MNLITTENYVNCLLKVISILFNNLYNLVLFCQIQSFFKMIIIKKFLKIKWKYLKVRLIKTFNTLRLTPKLNITISLLKSNNIIFGDIIYLKTCIILLTGMGASKLFLIIHKLQLVLLTLNNYWFIIFHTDYI